MVAGALVLVLQFLFLPSLEFDIRGFNLRLCNQLSWSVSQADLGKIM